MIKTVKGKVIAGTLAFGLVAGGGVAFGASDAGGNLKAWYDGQFGSTSQAGINEVATYAGSKAGGLATEYEGLKSAATTSINTTGETATAVGTENINQQSAEHIAAINQQKATIEGYMAGQFEELSNLATGLINKAGAAGLQAATSDLTSHTGAKGGAALTAVTTELNGVKGDALTQLTSAIGTAKSDLQAQLATEKASTVTEIKGLIDAKIIELRGEITTIKNNLVKAQQDLITAKASELEKAAKREMQSVVDGI